VSALGVGSRVATAVVVAMAAMTMTVACSSSSSGGTPIDAGHPSDSESATDTGAPSTDSGTTGETGPCNEGGANGGNCTASTPPFVSCADLAAPTVSFASDVLPVFQTSCGIAGATCHGNPMVNAKATGQPYLGMPTGGTDAGQVLAGIVGVPSAEDPQMNNVTAGQPAQSWLMHKLDGDQCLYAAQCKATGNPVFANCGLQQPYSSGVLDLATRDTIRRWIAQGAKDN